MRCKFQIIRHKYASNSFWCIKRVNKFFEKKTSLHPQKNAKQNISNNGDGSRWSSYTLNLDLMESVG